MFEHEDPTLDKEMLLAQNNAKRLESLMGDDYDSIEMDDYFSYIDPEHASQEINILEKKLLNGYPGRENILTYFKGHLAYLYACGEKGPFPVSE